MRVGKVLVTGAGGFIGSHLTELLIKKGYDVRAFVRYNSTSSWGWLENIEKPYQGKFEVFMGDIRDANGVTEAMKGIDVVLHLAALIGIPFSYHSPDAYVQTNVTGTLNILQAARSANVEKVICTSTSETYGSAQFVPITEDHPLQAQSPYSASKIAADQIALSFYRSFDLPVVILRPFNTYGPRQSTRAVIPTVISQIASGSKVIELGSLEPTRDFTYVSDTALGFFQAMLCEEAVGKVVNIGSGFEISIAETVNVISKAMGTKVEVVQSSNRMRPPSSEVDRLFAGTSQAEHLFGWSPEFGGLNGFLRGLNKTADWFQQQENLVLYKANQYNV